MSLILFDEECPSCRGRGHIRGRACPVCHGTGSIGGPMHIPDIPVPEPTPFGRRLRAWRLEHGRTFRELSAEIGILPGTLSEIENGRREPTEEQRKKIEELMR